VQPHLDLQQLGTVDTCEPVVAKHPRVRSPDGEGPSQHNWDDAIAAAREHLPHAEVSVRTDMPMMLDRGRAGAQVCRTALLE
jgi:hypothetical protein